MSAAHLPFAEAMAFQLMARLHDYELGVAQLMLAPLDAELYRRSSDDMDAMRLLATDVPMASVAWAEVMIRHFELMHGLWRVQRAPSGGLVLAPLHANLGQAVRRLSHRCLQLVAAP
ncbi:MAG TPA: hypothetical protein VHL79_08220 [Ramlibacter sp.]|jgi:hypothetical protein|nr:hypothetical protein [Ramlibacter sp.]